MPTLQLNKSQIMDLAEQLPPEEKEELFQSLLHQQWNEWVRVSQAGTAGAHRTATQRGLNWDTMAEEQREIFIDDVIHEDQ